VQRGAAGVVEILALRGHDPIAVRLGGGGGVDPRDPQPGDGALQGFGQVGCRIRGGQVDLVAAVGTVGWSLAADCNPANVRRLPLPVRMKLAKAIMRDTTLSEGEADF